MKPILSFLLLPLFASSIILSGLELAATVRLAMLAPVDELLPASGSPISPQQLKRRKGESNVYEVKQQYEDVLSMPLVEVSLGYRMAQLLYRIGLLEQGEQRRIEYFCSALGYLGSSIERQPFDSAMLVDWANLRQLLAGIECREDHTTGDFEQVARFALRQDKTNVEVLFSSAQILLWAGKKDEAFAILKSFLGHSLAPTDRQYSFIDRQLTSGADIRSIVPGHFPHIVEWSNRIRQRNPSLFNDQASVVAELQLEALRNNEQELKSGKIPMSLYFERLSSLLDVVGSSRVRQRIDGELSRYYGLRGQDRIRKYLEQRRTLDTIRGNTAFIQADTRPTKTALIDWQVQARQTLDHFYSSVGFYVPAATSVKIIELVGSRTSPAPPEVSLRLYVSDDNQKWTDVTNAGTVASYEIAGFSRVVFSLPDISHRYWKIHYSSASRDGKFTALLSDMVRIYGRHVD